MDRLPSFDASRLREIARHLRGDILWMIGAAGSGHPGGSLSAIDILAYLYFHRLEIRPGEPGWSGRDRFVLSKGHCAPAWYSALANRGFFPRELIASLGDIGSRLQAHPDMRRTPGVDMTTGSPGQGFAAAAGIALGAKAQGHSFRVYVMLSDEELQEGVVWEATMAAAHFRLDNLIAIADHNGLQTDGRTANIMNTAPIAEKFQAFGWDAVEIDGHDFNAIHEAVETAQSPNGRPRLIIARTVKGKGIPSLENPISAHSIDAPWTRTQTRALLAELDAQPLT